MQGSLPDAGTITLGRAIDAGSSLHDHVMGSWHAIGIGKTDQIAGDPEHGEGNIVMRSCTGWIVALAVACLFAVASISNAQSADEELNFSPSLAPSPKLTPEQVVRIQLGALRRNDSHNRGIEVAFRFASPDNKLQTGPLPRFIHMLQQGPYNLMLTYDNASYDPVEIEEDYARQRVILIGSGLVVAYEFYLSRQTEGVCIGCWMTDAVIAKRPSGLQVQS